MSGGRPADTREDGAREQAHGPRTVAPEPAVHGAALLAELMAMVGGTSDMQVALDTAAARALELLDARAVGLALIEGTEFVVVSRVGEQDLFPHQRAPVGAGRRAMAAIDSDRPVRLHPDREETLEALRGRAVLLAPMRFRGRTIGVLTAIERRRPRATFTAEDEPLAEAIASAVATVVAVTRSATDEALRRSVAATERERKRWARELHDVTLQNLAAIRMMVKQTRRGVSEPDDVLERVEDLLGDEIGRLRDIVHDLRPAVLDDLGLQPAVETAVARFTRRTGLDVWLDVDLAHEHGREPGRLAPEIESGVYYVVSEALGDLARRGRASNLELRIHERGGLVLIEIEHDDPVVEDDHQLDDVETRERVALVGGSLTVVRTDGHASVRAEVPVRRR